MRWIVISLLVVNAMILGWRWFTPNKPATPPRAQTVNSAPAIELLPDGAIRPVLSTETTTVETRLENSTVEAAASMSAPMTDVVTQTRSESVVTTDAAGAPTAPHPAADGSGSISAADSPTTNGSQVTDVVDAPPSVPVTTAVLAQTSAQCAWTSWRERPVTDLGVAELVQTEQQEQEIGRSYLVYIPAKTNRELTLQRLAELKAEGIEAAYLNKGPQAGGISLGLFSKPESMQLRLRELKKAGIADVSGIERIRTEPRIRQLLRWTGEKTPSSVQNQALVSCNDVASRSVEQ